VVKNVFWDQKNHFPFAKKTHALLAKKECMLHTLERANIEQKDESINLSQHEQNE